jgi:hypothetical protein
VLAPANVAGVAGGVAGAAIDLLEMVEVDEESAGGVVAAAAGISRAG